MTDDPLKTTPIRAYSVASLLIEEWKQHGVQDRTFQALLPHLEKAIDAHETEIENRLGSSPTASTTTVSMKSPLLH